MSHTTHSSAHTLTHVKMYDLGRVKELVLAQHFAHKQVVCGESAYGALGVGDFHFALGLHFSARSTYVGWRRWSTRHAWMPTVDDARAAAYEQRERAKARCSMHTLSRTPWTWNKHTIDGSARAAMKEHHGQ